MSRELIEPMEFLKIDKISDDVYALGPNVILKFNVSLSKTSNGKRYHYHKEYEYPTKIQGQPTLVTIKRSFDYYLSIENMQKDNNGNKLFIRIGPQEFLLFKKGIEEAVAWFTDSKYEKLFARNKGKLVLMAPIPEFKIRNLPMQKIIEFRPIIIDRGMSNEDKEPGVRMTLGDPSTFIDINLDRLMGLYYIISSFNMYQVAITTINYLQRPEFGMNRFSMESLSNTQNSNNHYNPSLNTRSGTSGIQGRFVTPVDEKTDIGILEK